MVNDEIRSEELEMPRRGSPLPWLLLGVTVIVAIGIFAMARGRLTEERLHTATSLKANDEVMGRLRTVASEFAKTQITVTELEAQKAVLEKQVQDLEQKNKALAADLEELKAKPKGKKR
jgi:septal ring factor EnvC (AmiA/AmiB activator)